MEEWYTTYCFKEQMFTACIEPSRYETTSNGETIFWCTCNSCGIKKSIFLRDEKQRIPYLRPIELYCNVCKAVTHHKTPPFSFSDILIGSPCCFCSICGEEKLKCEDDSAKITAILNNCSVYCNCCKAFTDNDEVTAVFPTANNSDEYRILRRTCERCGVVKQQ